MGPVRSLCAVSLLLSACSSQAAIERSQRLRGLEPRLDSQEIDRFANEQNSAAEKLALAAALPGKPASGDPRWKEVVDAGVFQANMDCNTYIGDLLRYEQTQAATKSGIALTSAATLASMGIFEASAEALAFVGTAFGLTGSLLESISATLIYDVPAPVVLTAIQNSRAAYRQGLGKRTFTTQTAALEAVYDYRLLCTPAMIKNTIGRAVSTAEIRLTEDAAPNGTPRLSINRDVERLQDASKPMPPVTPQAPATGIRNAASRAENAITREEGIRIQRALCVTPDGDFGVSTRRAITLFRHRPNTALVTDKGLNAIEVGTLLGAGACDGSYANAYERFTFRDPTLVRKLRSQLGDALGRTIQQLSDDGGFDRPLREAIKEFERSKGLDETGSVTPELLARLAL